MRTFGRWRTTGWMVLAGVALLRSFAGTSAEPPGAARPVHYVVGLSPFLADADKDPVYRALVGFLLETVPAGSSLWLYDAYHLRTIARIEVPDRRAFHSARTRANQFRDPVLALKQFLAEAPAPPCVERFDFRQAVRLPQFLDFVAANLMRPDREIVVLVLGSPLYLDAKEPGFSMVDGFFPSDGHLGAPRETSVYSLQQREHALAGVTVHFGWFGDPWVTEVHRDRILRFWTLYVGGQEARLGAFSGDLATVLNAVRDGAIPAADRRSAFAIDPAQSKVEMLRLTREVGADDWITRDELPDASPPPPTSEVGLMKIGIRWRRHVDLDLYARPRPGAETLFFEHTRSPDGFYFKDYRSSPEGDYEFIEFRTPVSVREVEAWINFYDGEAPGGLQGEVRIEFGGRVYAGDFALLAEHGNHGRAGRTQGDFWSPLDVPAILGLPRTTRSPAAHGRR
ncbi:MAG: hypothetical protein H7A47_03270 [Verrucomicrobiales bacterium]|nr:hypothetical protein [Verrucomicrobiales bacterium]